MNGGIFVDILLAILPVAVGIVTYINSQKALRSQAQTAEAEVDAQAYERARAIYESAIAAQSAQLDRMREQSDRQLALLNTEVNKLQESNATLRDEVFKLQSSNADLRTRVVELQSSNARLEAEIRILRDNNNE